MQGKSIADSGLLAQITIKQASFWSPSEVDLLCNQEEAYDRVHPVYLRSVLQTFGLPSVFISAVCSLFFSTTMKANVNGYSSSPIQLGRGLRQ
ncbi:uncharacterized protein RHIMIDRAFT_91853, partial [Rhizopus microsporus ATCC 52813]